ncbi:MAG: hypothetical protein FWD97_05465 [Defluviitaleaceae bacterium]|nr:hypothetical protein [Defluviitaleaceae bacterium]
MKKKIFFMALVVVVFAAFLAACGTRMDGGDDRLVGSWDWNGSLFYRFDASGTGSMGGDQIRWTTDGNRLYICNTPGSCGERCILPVISGTFSFSNNNDTLQFQGFTYHRR